MAFGVAYLLSGELLTGGVDASVGDNGVIQNFVNNNPGVKLNTISDPATSAGMHALYEAHGIPPDRIASVVAFAIEQPADTNVTEFTVGPTTQP